MSDEGDDVVPGGNGRPADGPQLGGDDRVPSALRSAVDGGALAAADHEALLALALGDDVAQYDDDDRAEAEALASALATGDSGHPLAQLATALRHAHRPTTLAPLDHDALLATALGVEASVDADERQAAEQLAFALEDESSAWVTALRLSVRFALLTALGFALASYGVALALAERLLPGWLLPLLIVVTWGVLVAYADLRRVVGCWGLDEKQEGKSKAPL